MRGVARGPKGWALTPLLRADSPGHCLSHLHLPDLPPQLLAQRLQLLLPLQGHLAFRRDGEGFRCPSMEAARMPGPELCPEGHLKKLPLENSRDPLRMAWSPSP